MSQIYDARIKSKRDTQANWESNNPLLLNGEIVLVDMTDGSLKIKIGNGTSNFNDLQYFEFGDSTVKVNWDDIQDKPSVFVPDKHIHTISDVTNLQNSLDGKSNTGHTHAISEISNLQSNLNNKANTSDLNDKMDSPTNTGSSGQFLRRSNSNQGTWSDITSYIGNASASSSGLMSSAMYSKVNGMYTWADAGSNSSSGGWMHFDNGVIFEWQQINVSNVSVNTALGSWYRSNSPYSSTAYHWKGMDSSSINPEVQMSFISNNSLSALVWINPIISYIDRYVPQCYLIRPTSTTGVSGYISVFAVGYNSYI